MTWTKHPSSQHAHYDAAACILNVRGEPFGMLVVDGDVVELLEFNTKRWWTLPAFPNNNKTLQACVMVSLQDQVYVVGGMHADGQFSDTVHSFQFGVSEWEVLPKSSKNNEPRCYPAAVGLKDCIVVLGGRNAAWQEVTTVESYTPESKEWKQLGSFQEPRMAPAAVTMEYYSRIVLLGGYNGTEWTTSVEVLDVAQNQWSSNTIPAMPHRVAFPQAVLVQQQSKTDTLIVLGTSVVQDVDEASFVVIQSYNVAEQKWNVLLSRPKNNTLFPREGCSLACLKGTTLFVVGGRENESINNENDNPKNGSKRVLQWKVDVEKLDGIFESPKSTTKLPSVGSVGSASQSQAIPPAIVMDNKSLDGLESTMTMTTAGRSQQSASSVVSQMPSRMPEEDIPTTTLTSPMVYKDCAGQFGNYVGKVATASRRPHSKGEMKWELSGNVYDGEWRHGYRQGYGRLTYSSGDVFEGWFQQDLKVGRGTYQWRDGRQYEGMYANDGAEDLNGTLSWKNGTLYVGCFTQGHRTGKGVIRFPNNVRYQGDFVNGKYHGFGSCTFQDGRVYTGYWRRGKAHGTGILTEADGTVLHDGQWQDDVPIGMAS
jgi:hypothetical protein